VSVFEHGTVIPNPQLQTEYIDTACFHENQVLVCLNLENGTQCVPGADTLGMAFFEEAVVKGWAIPTF